MYFPLLFTLSVSKKSNFIEAVKLAPASVIELVICFFSVWSILGLAGFHTYLMSSNQTTNEDIKGSFSSKRAQNTPSTPGGSNGQTGPLPRNPYSTGSVFKNCCIIMCGPTPPR